MLGTFPPEVWRQKIGANERKERVVGGDVKSLKALRGDGLSGSSSPSEPPRTPRGWAYPSNDLFYLLTDVYFTHDYTKGPMTFFFFSRMVSASYVSGHVIRPQRTWALM